MVIPVGGPAIRGENEEPPQSVKDACNCWWWFTLVLFMLVSAGRCIARDFFGLLIPLILIFWTWWMIKDRCKNMSQYCIFMYGVMCTMQGLLDLMFVLSQLGGRVHTTQSRTQETNGDVKKTHVTITEEKNPYFDPEEGFIYNAQSAVMIASAVVLIFAATVAYWTYYSFPTSLFEDPDEQQSFSGGGRPMYGGGGYNTGYGRGGGSPRSGGGSGSPTAGGGSHNSRLVFGGQGQRLGSG